MLWSQRRNRGAHGAEISIQISALAGVELRTLESSGANVATRLLRTHSFYSPLTTCRRIRRDNSNPEPAGGMIWPNYRKISEFWCGLGRSVLLLNKSKTVPECGSTVPFWPHWCVHPFVGHNFRPRDSQQLSDSSVLESWIRFSSFFIASRLYLSARLFCANTITPKIFNGNYNRRIYASTKTNMDVSRGSLTGSMCDLSPKRWEDRVCIRKYMHARTIHKVLAQGRHYKKVWSNPPNAPG